MRTSIGIIYFDEKLNPDRDHHSVSESLLNIWLKFYKQSNTGLKPVLLTDKSTNIPKVWKYEVVRINDDQPPYKRDVLHKVGWLKAQCYNYIGRCLILDLDCIIVNSIDEIDEINTSFAMPKEKNSTFLHKILDLKEKYNGGCIFQNTDLIFPMFKKYWIRESEHAKITYLDEIIFTKICQQLNGVILSQKYNISWDIGYTNHAICQYFNPESKIIHFHGYRKNELNTFLKSIIKL